MNTKALLGFAIMASFITMPIALLLNPMLETEEPNFVGYKAEFIGQDVAEVGELVRFLAEGDIVRWECLPQTTDSESYGESNENYVVSFRKPGVYNIIAAIYVDGDLSIHTQPVTVEGPPIVVPPDDPVVPVVKIDLELAGKVMGWCQKYRIDEETCTLLASNFSQVAQLVEKGDLVTPGQIISKTAEMNADLTLDENLMAELQAYLTSQSDLGNLKTPEQHVVAWNSIAKGLRDAIQ